MLELPEKDVPAIGLLSEFRVGSKAIDCRGEQICVVLQERNVVLVEIPTLSGIHFKYPPGCPLPLDNHIDHASDPMLDQQLRDFEPLLFLGIRRDHRLAFAERVAAGGPFMRPESGVANDARVPVHARSDQQAYRDPEGARAP